MNENIIPTYKIEWVRKIENQEKHKLTIKINAEKFCDLKILKNHF